MCHPSIPHTHTHTELVESTARITEARLNREQSEGKIIDYQRVGDCGYRVISYDAINCKEAKVLGRVNQINKHNCGTVSAWFLKEPVSVECYDIDVTIYTTIQLYMYVQEGYIKKSVGK